MNAVIIGSSGITWSKCEDLILQELRPNLIQTTKNTINVARTNKKSSQEWY
ncbi:hypothetical protein Glove_365g87 [Diversispora epigaea]|uniref:Uncharacterized protein n=1 Tax=Diversispora epigaea TaxID=1348612 RepID=A0A397HCB2_9GLOM|nr:hypothetical protein Glove_365g87 [Diversispora epigaea]